MFFYIFPRDKQGRNIFDLSKEDVQLLMRDRRVKLLGALESLALFLLVTVSNTFAEGI